MGGGVGEVQGGQAGGGGEGGGAVVAEHAGAWAREKNVWGYVSC